VGSNMEPSEAIFKKALIKEQKRRR
jgi:hypothetical protein